MIQHLAHSAIDKQLWDERLLRTRSPLWYARSWVLDATAPGWEALVDEERGAMMPLPWRRKWGVDYLYTPFALQQLGVFAPDPDAPAIARMLAAVPQRFRYWDLWLNEAMDPAGCAGFRLEERTEQTVAITAAGTLRAAYSEGHRRNLRKATIDRIAPFGWQAFVDLFERTTARKHGGLAAVDKVALSRLLNVGCERGEVEIKAAWEGDIPVAAIAFVHWNERTILLKSANTERGQALRALFILVDNELALRAPAGGVFDFAGSNDPGTARFNEGFGARRSIYLRLVRNRLPAPLRWLKR